MLSPDLIEDASAQKPEKNSGHVLPKPYGSATIIIICSDRLCSTPEVETDPVNKVEPNNFLN